MTIEKILFLLFFINFAGATNLDYDETDEYLTGFNFIRKSNKLWKDGTIPYKFRDDRYSGRSYSEEEKAMVRKQMGEMETQLGPGCINFVEDENCTNCLHFVKRFIDRCEATIGNTTEPYMNLESPECFEDNGLFHELGHVLGMAHEHIRDDRDEYVDLDEDLLEPYAKIAFRKKPMFGQTYQAPYDFKSIMHYPLKKGCVGNSTCMKIKTTYSLALNESNILKKYPVKLSPTDIYKISAAYNCSIDHTVVAEYVQYAVKIAVSKNNVKDCTSTNTIDTSTAESSTTATTTNKPTVCAAKGYTIHINTGHCYKVLYDKIRTWYKAKSECEAQGAELASIRSSQEWQFVKDNILSKVKSSVWLGGTDVEQEDTWLWTDNSPVTFTDWNPGYPRTNNRNYNCLIVNLFYNPST